MDTFIYEVSIDSGLLPTFTLLKHFKNQVFTTVFMHDDRLICDNTVYGIANPQAIAPVQTLKVRQRGMIGHCEVFTSGIVLT
jgi:hypothetical protein